MADKTRLRLAYVSVPLIVTNLFAGIAPDTNFSQKIILESETFLDYLCHIYYKSHSRLNPATKLLVAYMERL